MTQETLTTDALIVAYDRGRRDFSYVKIDNGDDGEEFCKTRNELNLEGVDLTGINLSHADLEDVNLGRATLVGANFSHADLDSTDFTEANLTGANLSYTDLCGTDLTKANCTRANLSHLQDFGGFLEGATFVGATFEGTSVSSSDRWQIAAVLEGALYDDNPNNEMVSARKRGIEYIRRSEKCWEAIVSFMRRYNRQVLVWGLLVLQRYEDLQEAVSEYNKDLYVAAEDISVRCEPGAFSDLRDGDKVGIRGEYGHGENIDYPANVLHMLPSGVLEVESHDLETTYFFPSGKNINPDDSGYTLTRWTQGLEDEQEANKLREQIDNTDFDEIGLLSLRMIVEAINRELPSDDAAPLDTPVGPGSPTDDVREYDW